MNIPGFSEESLKAANDLLDFAAEFFPANKKKCPPNTQAVGAGFCKNANPEKAGYILAIKKKCPPNTRAVGAGYCKVDHAEKPPQQPKQPPTPCPDKKPETAKKAEDTAPKPGPTQPKAPESTPATKSDPSTKKDPADKKPPCTKTAKFAEEQTLEDKRRKVKKLLSEGKPASILIKQIKDERN